MESKRGFAGYSPVQRRFVSMLGGSKKVPKGLAKLSPERRREIQRLGGLKRQEQIKKERYGKNPISSGNESRIS